MTGLSTELQVLRDVCTRLDGAQIRYMLTGSMAMNFYAQPRMTRDLDLVVELDRAQAAHFSQTFNSDYYVPTDDIDRAVAMHGMFNLIHLGSVVKVDFIVRKDAPYRRLEFDRRQRVHLEGFDCWIVSREDLILSKLVWAADSRSDFQLRDVRNLMDASMDMTYLHEHGIELGVEALLQEMLRG